MSAAGFWDALYEGPGYRFGTEPAGLLAASAKLVRPGMKALALADGEGRNGVWLAERGAEVLAVDVSPVARAKAEALAEARGVGARYRAVTADLLCWAWPEAAFDLVLIAFIAFAPAERRRVHRAALAALRPGGILLLECFSAAQRGRGTGGPREPEKLYTPQMLRADFAAAAIEHLSEAEIEGPEGAGAVVRLLARRLPFPDRTDPTGGFG
ncbi:MAG: class I SAM-dependent methyltransferase [Acetobacteraceae bacterium]|nr:class I SAM-dependent methyltransferase [Acetobacteraceae bacterium]MDW8398110.1 class I SAM-dependent methyltransferase [Acetobacteraceae bacterium]